MYEHDINDIEKIEIIMSSCGIEENISIYEKLNGKGKYKTTLCVGIGEGVQWVYDNILNKCEDYKPEVWVVNAIILRHKLDV